MEKEKPTSLRVMRSSNRSTGSQKTCFKFPFDDAVLLDIWESHLALLPQDMLKWIEGDEVKQQLWLWTGVMLWEGRKGFQNGFKKALAKTKEGLTDEEKSSEEDDVNALVWTRIRERMIVEVLKWHNTSHMSSEERKEILNMRAQDFIRDKDADWEMLWLYVSFNLVTRGSKGLGETMPFHGKESSRDACHRVVLQLLHAVWTEMCRDDVNHTYFRDLLQIQVVSVQKIKSLGTTSRLSLFPFGPQNLVRIWSDNISSAGVEHTDVIRWANAEYVEKIICDWWEDMTAAGETPTFRRLFESKLKREDGELEGGEIEEMTWINMREALYQLPTKFARLPGNRWPEVTDEQLQNVKGWKHPWVRATLSLLAEGSKHPSPEMPFHAEGLSTEDCAEVCVELLKAVYEDIDKDEGEELGHWAGIFYRRKQADVQGKGISVIVKEDSTDLQGKGDVSSTAPSTPMAAAELEALAQELQRPSCAPSTEDSALSNIHVAQSQQQQPRKSNKRTRGARDIACETSTPKRARKAPPSTPKTSRRRAPPSASNRPQTPQCCGKKRARDVEDETSKIPVTPAKRTKKAAPSKKPSTSTQHADPTSAIGTASSQEPSPDAAAGGFTSSQTQSPAPAGISGWIPDPTLNPDQVPTSPSSHNSITSSNPTEADSQQTIPQEAGHPGGTNQHAEENHTPMPQQVRVPPPSNNDTDFARLYQLEQEKSRLLQLQIERQCGVIEHQDGRIAALTVQNSRLVRQIRGASSSSAGSLI